MAYIQRNLQESVLQLDREAELKSEMQVCKPNCNFVN